MKRLRRSYWFALSIVKRHTNLIVISALVGGGLVFLTPKIAPYLPYQSVTYIGRVGAVTLSQLPEDIQRLISDGLTTLDASGEPQPNLAQSWEVLENGRVFHFTLNPNRYWQDGKKLIAEDVNYGFEEITKEAPSNESVIFTLKDPFAPFPAIVSQPIFRRITKRSFLLFKKTNIIGTGQFRITRLTTKSNNLATLTLKSAEETRTYRFYPTEEEAITAFKLGKIDRLENISDPRDLASWPNTRVKPTTNYNQHVVMLFNTTHPDLSSKSIRQALAYAIPDKEWGGIRAVSPIPPDSWAYNPQVKTYDFDPEAAKRILEQEFPNGLTLQNVEITTTPTFAQAAESIAKAWADLGITTSVKITNFLDTNDYQILLIGQKVPSDPDQYTLWHSTQPTNITRYNSPRVDKLLEDGRTTIAKDERTLIYQDFQRFLVEDSPVIFLHFLTTYTIERQ